MFLRDAIHAPSSTWSKDNSEPILSLPASDNEHKIGRFFLTAYHSANFSQFDTSVFRCVVVLSYEASFILDRRGFAPIVKAVPASLSEAELRRQCLAYGLRFWLLPVSLLSLTHTLSSSSLRSLGLEITHLLIMKTGRCAPTPR